MSGFSADWLALREAADHRSRHMGLGRALAQRMRDRNPVRVIDFGAGTGSNLRATAPLLGESQEWTLVDYDPALIEAAVARLTAWADEARAIGDQLVLVKGRANIGVTFRLADLNAELETLLAGNADLVTASALFDLISPPWMARFAAALAGTGAAFYTVLTYSGHDDFLPAHPLDHAVTEAFALHQQRDKGFGPAAGPAAARVLAESLRRAGYKVEAGDSPWVLGVEDEALVRELLGGVAGAVGETGRIEAEKLAEWLAFRLKAAGEEGARLVTGHTDILAYRE